MIQRNDSYQITSPFYSHCKIENREEELMDVEEKQEALEGIYNKLRDDSSSDSNWIYLCSENNVDNYIPDDRVMKIVEYKIVPIQPKINLTLHLFTGLFLTDDGSLRYTPSLDSVSFGFEQSKVERIEEIKKLKVVDIQFKAEKFFKQTSYEDAINFAYRTNQIQFEQIAQAISKMQAIYNLIESQKDSFGEEILKKLDEEYECFKSACFEFLAKYVEQNPNVMFKYNIERFNYFTQDCEHSNTGYSKSFLELIGLDADSLNQLFQRNKRVDLIKNKLDITFQTIQWFEKVNHYIFSPQELISYIVTFDGFPIRLLQRQKKIQLRFHDELLGRGGQSQNFLILNEIDIDIYDLEQLILYRQNLISNGDHMKVEDFIQKELSFLFEDVEYSIHSQHFIDKFYQSNIKSLQELKQQKLKEKITCKYKFISDEKS